MTTSGQNSEVTKSESTTPEGGLPAIRRKFVVFAPSYNESIGGTIILHKLCHLLNGLGQQSFVAPYFFNHEINRLSIVSPILRVANDIVRHSRYATNPALNTPVLRRREVLDDDTIVIYPEIVKGNPLNAKKIVRWLLYPPGSQSGKICFGTGELYVPYNAPFGKIEIPGSRTLTEEMRVVHYPLDIYKPPAEDAIRRGTAYLVRKGSNKALVHHDRDAIKIDGLSHAEIAEIFRKVETFVSYDSYTAYSFFAAVSGCDSVVIPDEGVDEETWYPNAADRDGIAYGWDRLDHARSTRHRVLPRLLAQESANYSTVRRFLAEVDDYFGPNGPKSSTVL